jgi:hypothetical protein
MQRGPGFSQKMNKRTYAKEVEHSGIKMKLVGCWDDLAAYYSGSDGNAWCWSACTNSWANDGPIERFLETFNHRRRGRNGQRRLW